MKTNLFIAALSLVVLAGCSSEDEVGTLVAKSDNSINFTTYVGKQTKAAVEENTLTANTKFGVFAYHTKDATWESSKATATPNFMFNQEVTFDGTNYTYSPVKYWPNAEKVSFIGYYPFPTETNGVSVSSDFTNQSTGLPKIEFTIPSSENGVTDLLVSTVANDKSKETVSLTFQHVLSKVKFSAQTIAEGSTVTINTITLTGIKNGGTYDCAAGTWTSSTTDLNNTITADQAYLMVPQSIENAKVAITYTVTTTDSNLNESVTFNGEAKDIALKYGSVTQWDKNKVYNYTIDVSLSDVQLSATVSPWDTTEEKPEINK